MPITPTTGTKNPEQMSQVLAQFLTRVKASKH
jgi:hypothetical protein